MKTILIILSLSLLASLPILLFVFTNIVGNMSDCKFRRFYNRHIVEFEEPIKFNNIKPVSLADKIRVFNNFGNHLCDIKQGEFPDLKNMSIAEACEVIYIYGHYLEIYKKLSK
jgi:hypothetical protein